MLEATLVIETQLGDAGEREFDLWLHKIGAEIVPIDSEQTEAARHAWRLYGKGPRGCAELRRLLCLRAGTDTQQTLLFQGR